MGQELTLFGKDDAGTEIPIAAFPDLPEDFIAVHLDIQPGSRAVTLFIDSVFRGSFSFPLTGVPNSDHFVTLLSWDGTSEFDSVNVQLCAP